MANFESELDNIIDHAIYHQWECCDDALVKMEISKLHSKRIIVLMIYSRNIGCFEGITRKFIEYYLNGSAEYYKIDLDADDLDSRWKYIYRKYLGLNTGKYCVVSIEREHFFEYSNRLSRLIHLGDKKYRVYRQIREYTFFLYLAYNSELGYGLSEFACNSRNSLKETMTHFADKQSVDQLLEVLRAGLYNEPYRLHEGDMIKKYWELYRHLDDEVWVNCGAASGDTIIKYLINGYKFERIYAFEGERKIYEDLLANVSELPENLRNGIICKNCFLGSENEENSFDVLFRGERVTLINMDIEGAEMSVLKGASEVIKRNRPVLAICAYHDPRHLIEIPGFVLSCCENYRIFFRKYTSPHPQYLSEWIYYCIPEERI